MQMSKLAFAGLTLLAAPAYGQGQSPIVVEGGVPTAIVSYADLNIGSHADWRAQRPDRPSRFETVRRGRSQGHRHATGGGTLLQHRDDQCQG